MLEIIRETAELALCVKPVGVRAQGEGETDLPALLSRQLGCSIYPVHRLDQAVGGVMVFAKTERMAAKLSKTIQEGNSKGISGCAHEAAGGGFRGTSRSAVPRPVQKQNLRCLQRAQGRQKAALSYRVLAESDGRCLAHVRLYTGRTHQIRVQFASRGCPLVGDGKYGSRVNAASPALWSYALTLPGVGGKEERFCALPEMQGAWEPFSDALSHLDSPI